MKNMLCVTAIAWLSLITETPKEIIPNGDFENYKRCPKREACFHRNSVSWFSPNEATPDLFAVCSSDKFASANNSCAFRCEPFSGMAFCGIALYTKVIPDYREYISVRLNEQLTCDSTYRLQFHIRISDYSQFAVDSIGVLFSKSLPKSKTKSVLPKPTIGLTNVLNPANDTLDWRKITVVYTAKGGENYLTIGNFSTDLETKTSAHHNLIKNKMISGNSYFNISTYSYYAIDSVSLRKYQKTNQSNSRKE